MRKEITLCSPKTTIIIATTENESSFNLFIDWLKTYHPAKTATFDAYPIRSENKLSACRIKARKLNLEVIN